MIGLCVIAASNTKERRHQSPDGAGHLVAVEIKVGVTLHHWAGEVTLHTVKECADRIGRQGRRATLQVDEDRQLITASVSDRSCVDPGANCRKALLGVGALRGTARCLKVDQVIEATERQVEQVDVVANVARQEACRKGEAARNSIDRCLRLGKESRHARIALEGHAVTGERDFRSARWRVRRMGQGSPRGSDLA